MYPTYIITRINQWDGYLDEIDDIGGRVILFYKYLLPHAIIVSCYFFLKQ